jgi:hypothetical protein
VKWYLKNQRQQCLPHDGFHGECIETCKGLLVAESTCNLLKELANYWQQLILNPSPPSHQRATVVALQKLKFRLSRPQQLR